MRMIRTHIAVAATLLLSITWFTTSAPTVSAQEQAQQDQAQWGEIAYPLPGNLRSEAGTLIVHFRIEAGGLDAEPGPWFFPATNNPYYRFKVLNLAVNDENNMMIYWYRGRAGRGRIQAAVGNLPGNPQSMPDRRSRVSGDWQPYGQHWVGYTWDEQGTHTFWADGQLIRQQGVSSPELGLGPVSGEGQLTLGADISPITVYGVHVLDHALTEEDLLGVAADQPGPLFKPRRGSLLLDRFDGASFEPNGWRQTRAATISGFTNETGGTPTDACRFVDTPFGQGLRLYSPPAEVKVP